MKSEDWATYALEMFQTRLNFLDIYDQAHRHVAETIDKAVKEAKEPEPSDPMPGFWPVLF